ncbi:MAG: beta-ketoacyl synthase N-terminal-like domain-containing protein [Thermodesulfovibrionales bacterium]
MEVVITSADTISPTLQKPTQRLTQRFKSIEDFFDINKHNTLDLDLSQLRSKDARIMRKHTLMLIKATESTYKKSRLDEISPEGIGLFMSLGIFDYEVDDLLQSTLKSTRDNRLNYSEFFKKGYREIYPLWPLMMLNNIAMCQCAIRLGIKGDNAVFSPHSDSSLNAIYEGWMSVLEHHSDVAIVGALSEIISPISLVRYVLCNTNSSRIGNTPAIPPYCLSEGAVTLSLERRENAQKRGLQAVAVLKGFSAGFGFDEIKGGVSIQAIEKSMNMAIQMAGISPNEIDIVFTHHDTEIDDGINEYRAIKDIFDPIPTVLSTKSIFGDMLACAGAFDVALAIKTFLDPHYIRDLFNKNIENAPYHILINAMSVEGNVTTLVLGRV